MVKEQRDYDCESCVAFELWQKHRWWTMCWQLAAVGLAIALGIVISLH